MEGGAKGGGACQSENWQDYNPGLATRKIKENVVEIKIKTQEKEEIIDITNKVKQLIDESNYHTGLVLVSTGHTTCGLALMEFETGLIKDTMRFLEKVAKNATFFHRHEDGTNNTSAHIKAMLIGQSLLIPLNVQRLRLGEFQNICFLEFDGGKRRFVDVVIIGN